MQPSRVIALGDHIVLPAMSEHNIEFKIKIERSLLHAHFGADRTYDGDCASVTPTVEAQFTAVGLKKFREHPNAEVFITEHDLADVLTQAAKI